MIASQQPYPSAVIKGALKAGDLINVEAVIGAEAAKNTPQSGDEFGLFFLSSSAGGACAAIDKPASKSVRSR